MPVRLRDIPVTTNIAPPVEVHDPMAMAAAKPSTSVRIRMYRQGLGDCFLITLPGSDGPFHMVIDCGVVLGTDADGIRKLQQAVDDITEQTNGKIDLLVLTH